MRLARLAACRNLLFDCLDRQLMQMAFPAHSFSSVATAGCAWPSRLLLAHWKGTQRKGTAALSRRHGSATYSSAAAAGQSAASGGRSLQADTPVVDAVRLTCEQLGRPYASEVAEALLDNWYTTAGELAALPDETARSLGIPLRLRAAVAAALQASEAASIAGTLQAQGAAATTPGGEAQWEAAVQHAQQRSRSSSRGGHPFAEAAAARTSQQQQQEGSVGESLQPADDRPASNASSVSKASIGSLATAAQRTTAAAVDPFSLPIEQRRCPLQRRFGNSIVQAPRVVPRSRAARYALSVSSIAHLPLHPMCQRPLLCCPAAVR